MSSPGSSGISSWQITRELQSLLCETRLNVEPPRLLKIRSSIPVGNPSWICMYGFPRGFVRLLPRPGGMKRAECMAPHDRPRRTIEKRSHCKLQIRARVRARRRLRTTIYNIPSFPTMFALEFYSGIGQVRRQSSVCLI